MLIAGRRRRNAAPWLSLMALRPGQLGAARYRAAFWPADVDAAQIIRFEAVGSPACSPSG